MGSGQKARILVIDDERTVCISCKRILEEEGHEVDYELSGTAGVERAVAGDHDLVLLDLRMPDMNGLEAIERIKKERPDLQVIIITGYATIQTSIEAVKKGAFDYVPKPFTPEELSLAVGKALNDRNIRSENEFLKEELTRHRHGSGILGRSRAMEEILRQVAKVAPTEFTVTIYGESGTGKELIAHAIHQGSLRAARPFIAVDVSALAPGLVESELFGHVRGAFTGATQNRPGYFTVAHGGTLFLDEISNVGLDLQGRLLRVIESRRVRPVGSEHDHEIDVRLLAATNRDLAAMVAKGEFREDLFYRLNVIPLTVPPLRERGDDIPLLAMHFLRKAARDARSSPKGFTTEAMARLVAYRWPGNVRELRNVAERLAATVEGELVGVDNLPEEMVRDEGMGIAPAAAETPITAEELKDSKRRLKEMVYARVEREFVLKALNHAGWNVTRAADAVGMLRPNFHALMRKYGVRSRDDSE